MLTETFGDSDGVSFLNRLAQSGYNRMYLLRQVIVAI